MFNFESSNLKLLLQLHNYKYIFLMSNIMATIGLITSVAFLCIFLTFRTLKKQQHLLTQPILRMYRTFLNILIIELFEGLILVWAMWFGGALLLFVKVPHSATLTAIGIVLFGLRPLVFQIITLVYVKPCKWPQIQHLHA